MLAADRTGGEGYTDGTDDPEVDYDNFGDDYVIISGTSHATPLVAGIVALILPIHPNLSVDETEKILRESAIDLGEPGKDDSFGWGLPDAERAVLQAASIFSANFETGDLSQWPSTSQ